MVFCIGEIWVQRFRERERERERERWQKNHGIYSVRENFVYCAMILSGDDKSYTLEKFGLRKRKRERERERERERGGKEREKKARKIVYNYLMGEFCLLCYNNE